MTKFKKGQKMVCVPCGREVSVDCCGMSASTVWCCGQPMTVKTKSRKKKK